MKLQEEIIASYALLADESKAAGMKKYMRDHFDFFGIPKPLRVDPNKILFKETDLLPVAERIKLAKLLWRQPWRELQYFAMEMISRKKKEWPLEIHLLFDRMILEKSWWDTVDFIAVNLYGPYFRLFPEMRKTKLAEWKAGNSFWLHRTSILFQLKYRELTDEKLLFSLCKHYAAEKEFFMRKAIGWALREYSKTSPAAVRTFLSQTECSALSRKEASKYL